MENTFKYARWDQCFGLGITLAIIAILYGVISWYLALPISEQSLTKVRGEIVRVEIISPRKSGTYVKLWLRGASLEPIVVKNVQFLKSGMKRFEELRAGEPVEAWITKDGWTEGERSNIWQLDALGTRVLSYTEMLEAVCQSAEKHRLIFTWGLLAFSCPLIIIGAISRGRIASKFRLF